jgi:hypothetical protein
LIVVRAAVLHRLWVLVACVALAVIARPLATDAVTTRAVAELVAASNARPADVSPTRAPARRVRAATPVVASVARRSSPSDVASPRPRANGRAPHRGTSPLYLTQARFLL